MEFHEHTPFRTACSKISQFVSCLSVGFCISSPLLQEEASLKVTDFFFFFRTVIFGFPMGPWAI